MVVKLECAVGMCCWDVLWGCAAVGCCGDVLRVCAVMCLLVVDVLMS